MAEKEKRGRPDRKLADQNNRPEGQNGERRDSENDWVSEMFKSLAEEERRDKKIFGDKYEKPSQNFIFKRVADVLMDMRRGCVHASTGDYIRIDLDRKSQADIDMVTEGFKAIAYEHLHAGYQSDIQIHFEQNLKRGINGIELKTDTPFDEFRKEFKDRFELTYEQAKTLQKIAKRVNLTYDPGGRKMTPENIAKRTFHNKDYLHRPIRRDRGY